MGRPRRAGNRPTARPPVPTAVDVDAPTRFRSLDGYRVRREWARYEGTPQRDLFRHLRERFLARHAVPRGRVLDLGCGPGRFTPWVGGAEVLRIGLDLADLALREIPEHWPADRPLPDRVRGDGTASPFRDASFAEVVLLGNSLGFAGPGADLLLASAMRLVTPGGTIVVESAPGSPTTSRYLRRLPTSALVRLLRAPVRAVRPRVEREGFDRDEVRDRTRHGFRPISETELTRRLAEAGFEILESSAVAPALGNLPERLLAVHADPVAWTHLVALEELLGNDASLREKAASLLLAARRPGDTPERGVK
jgi:SAM-dependent methyltransferase